MAPVVNQLPSARPKPCLGRSHATTKCSDSRGESAFRDTNPF